MCRKSVDTKHRPARVARLHTKCTKLHFLPECRHNAQTCRCRQTAYSIHRPARVARLHTQCTDLHVSPECRHNTQTCTGRQSVETMHRPSRVARVLTQCNLEAEALPPLPSYRPATSWVHYTTSCNTESSAPEDGRDHRPKHVELIGIINKPLLLHLVDVYIIYVKDARSNKYQNQILHHKIYTPQIPPCYPYCTCCENVTKVIKELWKQDASFPMFLLTVHLGTILVNKQIEAQFFFRICLFRNSTCFEQPCAYHQENELYQYDIWHMSLCVGDRLVGRYDWNAVSK